MKKTQDKEIFEYFNISKKTWYNWKKPDNPKHRIYLALVAYWGDSYLDRQEKE